MKNDRSSPLLIRICFGIKIRGGDLFEQFNLKDGHCSNGYA